MESFDSILLNGRSLRPAPFVSTTYEYTKSGIYTIGGFLIVTLTGTLVGVDIESKISELNSLQGSTDCVNLIIGCSGQPNFLNGDGRITSIDITQDDEPYVAFYTIVIKIETIGGEPVVKPDPNFARSIGVSTTVIPRFLTEYSENLTIDGDGDIISTYDGGMNISKANMKISGSIVIKANTTYICGMPSYNPINEIEQLLIQRSSSLLNVIGENNPLVLYTSWQKFLDTKSLEIQNNGTVTWQFNCYILQGGGTPLAFIDVNTTDKKTQKTDFNTRTISGTINGLSLATISDHLGHKADANERYSNAKTAFTSLENLLTTGQWPGSSAAITGQEGADCDDPSGCLPFIPPKCYQRISHNITSSVVSGQISFDMEFADISACASTEFDIETTIDENLPVNLVQEIVVPSRPSGRSIVQKIGGSSYTVNIVVRGSLKGCNEDNLPLLITAVITRMNGIIFTRYSNFFINKQSTILGKFTYTLTVELIRCDLF